MREPVQPAATSDTPEGLPIADCVASKSVPGSPTGGTSAGDMTPIEAAILAISQDIATMLRMAQQLQQDGRSIQEQGRKLETVARALAADMAEVRQACGLRV